MEEKKEEDMDVAENLYVASDLYEEDNGETGAVGFATVSDSDCECEGWW